MYDVKRIPRTVVSVPASIGQRLFHKKMRNVHQAPKQ